MNSLSIDDQDHELNARRHEVIATVYSEVIEHLGILYKDRPSVNFFEIESCLQELYGDDRMHTLVFFEKIYQGVDYINIEFLEERQLYFSMMSEIFYQKNSGM